MRHGIVAKTAHKINKLLLRPGQVNLKKRMTPTFMSTAKKI